MGQGRLGEADGIVTYSHVRGGSAGSGGSYGSGGVTPKNEVGIGSSPKFKEVPGRSSDTGLGVPSPLDLQPAALPANLPSPPSCPAAATHQPQAQQQPPQLQRAFPLGPGYVRSASRPGVPTEISRAVDEYSEEGSSERGSSPRSATSSTSHTSNWAASPRNVRCQGWRVKTC